MRQLLFTLKFAAIAATQSVQAQPSIAGIKTFEHQLEDVMEITDTALLKNILTVVETECDHHPSELAKVRLGIVCHEVALNLSFLSKTAYKGYAGKSYALLNELFISPQTSPDLMPFVSSYRASALSLMAAENGKLKLLGDAFGAFDVAVKQYGEVSYLPEFLRGSVAENLPWFFYFKRKHAVRDFESLVLKQERSAEFAPAKIMSFTYWAWAKSHPAKKYRKLSIAYLDNAISLDPDFRAGRSRAEELKLKMK